MDTTYSDNNKNITTPPTFGSNTQSYNIIGHVPQMDCVMPNPHITCIQNKSNTSMCNVNGDRSNQNLIEASEKQSTYIGESPWLSIEARLNNIRSAGVQQPVMQAESKPSTPVKSIYSNYNTDYIHDDSWKVETNQKLSNANLKIHNKVEETVENVVPRRRAFKSLVEMADSLGSMEPSDQTNMIKLLLSCRKLEKLIEEQQAVLNLLNNDLKEANEMLKIPPELRNTVAIGPVPSTKPFYPTSEAPAFIKGRISLLPERYAASKTTNNLTPSFANLVAMNQNNHVIQEAK